jgi:putative transposase
MRKGQRTCTQEFKLEAVRLVQTTGNGGSQIARDLGMADSPLSHWGQQYRQHGEPAFPGSGHQTPQEEELRRLKRELDVMRQERDIFKKGVDRFFTNVRMKYQFMDEYQQEFEVKTMCRVLSGSESGDAAWKKHGPSQRAREDQPLIEQIRLAYPQGRQVYGSPRIQAELGDQGMRGGKNRGARLRRQAGLRVVHKRRPMTPPDRPHTLPVAPNLLQRDLRAAAPNRKGLADLTAGWTAEGWVYRASILEVYSRLGVGWAMEAHRGEQLTERARLMALGRRQPSDELLHHSDRGSQ